MTNGFEGNAMFWWFDYVYSYFTKISTNNQFVFQSVCKHPVSNIIIYKLCVTARTILSDRLDSQYVLLKTNFTEKRRLHNTF